MSTSAEVYRILEKKYEPPAWAMFREVRSCTGFSKAERYADALAFGIWPSRGYKIIGFEIKVSRGDWIKELKDPAKSDAIQKYCDHWIIAVSNTAIIKASEVPETWGVVLCANDKLVSVKEAPKLEPAALDMAFVASVMRATLGKLGSEKNSSFNKGFAEGKAQAEAQPADHTEGVYKRQLEAIQHRIADFEERSGIKIDEYDAGRQGSAVKLVMEMMYGFDPVDDMARLSKQLKASSLDIEKKVAKLTEVRKEILKNGLQG